MHKHIENFKEKYGAWALVTGGSSGIGQGLATVLAQHGIHTVIVSNQQQELQATSEILEQQYGVKCIPCYLDLADPDFLQKITTITDQLEIGMVFNNASYGKVGSFLSHDITAYHTMIDVNVKAYLTITHHFLQKMVAANRGAMVYTSSINAFSPIANSAVYTATKAFELYVNTALWQEMKGSDLDFMTIMPGPTRTGFQAKAGTKEAGWIKDPFELAEEALLELGKALIFIPDNENRILASVIAGMTMEERVQKSSEILEKALLKGEL